MEFMHLQEANTEYVELLENLDRLQQRCTKDINHQRYRLNQINGNLKKWVENFIAFTKRTGYVMAVTSVATRR